MAEAATGSPGEVTQLVQLGDYCVAQERPQLRGRKTKVWAIRSRDGGEIAEVKWAQNWRRYALFPYAGTLYDAHCLELIARFCRERTEAHKNAG